MEPALLSSRPRRSSPPPIAHERSTAWCHRLPTLHASSFVLREVEAGDAEPLAAAISTDEVARFIAPPPPNAAAFRSFIAHAIAQRQEGRLACLAVAPAPSNRAIGIFQVCSLSQSFDDAEWGFALAAEYWGTQVFAEAAQLVVEFAFLALGVRRLEARVAVRNGRANGALRKLGAVQEGLLRSSFLSHGAYMDQALWTILAEEWSQIRGVSNPSHAGVSSKMGRECSFATSISSCRRG